MNITKGPDQEPGKYSCTSGISLQEPIKYMTLITNHTANAFRISLGSPGGISGILSLIIYQVQGLMNISKREFRRESYFFDLMVI